MNEQRVTVWAVICPESGLIFGVEKELTDAYRLQRKHELSKPLIKMERMRPSDLPELPKIQSHPVSGVHRKSGT